MASTQTSSNSKPKMKFRAIDNFDHTDLPPDLPEGKWDFVIKKATARSTKSNDPMVSLVLEVTKAHDDEHEALVGKTVDDMVIFYDDQAQPERTRASKMQKVRMRQICEAFELETDIIPTSISEDGHELFEYAEALQGAQGTAWTTVRTDTETNESRTNVLYAEPAGGMTRLEPADDDDAPSGKKKPAAKKHARR
jgi:hypothetical protein